MAAQETERASHERVTEGARHGPHRHRQNPQRDRGSDHRRHLAGDDVPWLVQPVPKKVLTPLLASGNDACDSTLPEVIGRFP